MPFFTSSARLRQVVLGDRELNVSEQFALRSVGNVADHVAGLCADDLFECDLIGEVAIEPVELVGDHHANLGMFSEIGAHAGELGAPRSPRRLRLRELLHHIEALSG